MREGLCLCRHAVAFVRQGLCRVFRLGPAGELMMHDCSWGHKSEETTVALADRPLAQLACAISSDSTAYVGAMDKERNIWTAYFAPSGDRLRVWCLFKSSKTALASPPHLWPDREGAHLLHAVTQWAGTTRTHALLHHSLGKGHQMRVVASGEGSCYEQVWLCGSQGGMLHASCLVGAAGGARVLYNRFHPELGLRGGTSWVTPEWCKPIHHSMMIDRSGRVHVLWLTPRANSLALYHRVKTAGGWPGSKWLEPVLLGPFPYEPGSTVGPYLSLEGSWKALWATPQGIRGSPLGPGLSASDTLLSLEGTWNPVMCSASFSVHGAMGSTFTPALCGTEGALRWARCPGCLKAGPQGPAERHESHLGEASLEARIDTLERAMRHMITRLGKLERLRGPGCGS